MTILYDIFYYKGLEKMYLEFWQEKEDCTEFYISKEVANIAEVFEIVNRFRAGGHTMKRM